MAEIKKEWHQVFMRLWVTQTLIQCSENGSWCNHCWAISARVKYMHNLWSSTSTPMYAHCRDAKTGLSTDIGKNVHCNTLCNTTKLETTPLSSNSRMN